MYFMYFQRDLDVAVFLQQKHIVRETRRQFYAFVYYIFDQLHKPGKNGEGVYYLKLWKYMYDIPKRIAAAS